MIRTGSNNMSQKNESFLCMDTYYIQFLLSALTIVLFIILKANLPNPNSLPGCWSITRMMHVKPKLSRQIGPFIFLTRNMHACMNI